MDEKKRPEVAPKTEYKGSKNISLLQGCGEILAGVTAEIDEAITAAAQDIWTEAPFKPISLSMHIPPVEHLYEDEEGRGYAQRGKANAITSIGAANFTGGGKSTTTEIFSAATSQNVDKIGSVIPRCHGMVGYFEAEMGESMAQEYLRNVQRITERAGGTFDESKIVCASYDPEKPTVSDVKFQWILKAMDYFKFALAIIDPWQKFVDDQPDEAWLEERINLLDAAAQRNNTALLVVAHGTKSDLDKNLCGRSGTKLMQNVSTLLTVEHIKKGYDDYFQVETSKNRRGVIKPFRWAFVGSQQDEMFPFPYSMPSTESATLETVTAYVNAVFKDSAELSSGEINSLLQQIANCQKSRANDIISDAKKYGVIIESRRQGAKIFYQKSTAK